MKRTVEEQVQHEIAKRKRMSDISGKDVNLSKNLIDKSPSDTLIYTPAVARKETQINLEGTPPGFNSTRGRSSTFLSPNTFQRLNESMRTGKGEQNVINVTNADAINDTLSHL